ncbi:hypothetical protein RCS94_10340 [Orbaceae bacterium ac157xtp]
MIAPSSYGALSATSANTIQGSRPGFTGQSGAKKLGFVVNGTTYSQSLNNISPSVAKEFNKDLKLSDFTVTNLTASDFSPTSDYEDADGDLAHPTTPFSMSPRTFEWIESNNHVISTANYNQTLGCSGFNMPLTLRITLPNVKVKSRYGNPNESIATELVQEYKIMPTPGICFAKPNSLYWQSYWGPSGNSTNGGGYNVAQFDPANGFKADLATKFPTTGFPGAEFTLVMIGNATDYTFTHNGGSAVTVGTDGKVTLNNKPSGPVTIEARYNNAPPSAQPDEYTFDPRTVWVVPKKNPAHAQGKYNYDQAKIACGKGVVDGVANRLKIPNRAQLTNSPMKTGYEDVAPIPPSYYRRAVGEGVFGEWGSTIGGNYPSSQWGDNRYWTRDYWTGSGVPFTVYPQTGSVTENSWSIDLFVACLE